MEALNSWIKSFLHLIMQIWWFIQLKKVFPYSDLVIAVHKSEKFSKKVQNYVHRTHNWLIFSFLFLLIVLVVVKSEI